MAKVLIVEDDKELSAMLAQYLTQDGYTVEISENGAEAIEFCRNYEYDLVVLDWNLPEVDGLHVLQFLRSIRKVTPVLMLTGRTKSSEIEQALDDGADDYLTKPFHAREFSARVRALIRRASQRYESSIVLRDLEIDMRKHRVTRDGQEIKLQPKEFAVLEFFARHPNESFSTESLLARLWSAEVDASPDTVRVCINRLRTKIDLPDQPSLIRTVHKVGYRLDSQ
jgi:two-component system copper resistance phosphate regulon response regulator CusR